MNFKEQTLNPILMSQYSAMLSMVELNSMDDIKNTFLKFNKASNIVEAKTILKENFPESEGKTSFMIQGVKITICDKKALFRICADFLDEFICYEFNR